MTGHNQVDSWTSRLAENVGSARPRFSLGKFALKFGRWTADCAELTLLPLQLVKCFSRSAGRLQHRPVKRKTK